ncbi:MAG: hypothetical protein GTN99_08090 [Candidatus Dadabacteria bacterium]|nr:hypothetical protein [Candidatus Dadabacteria bacterium]
MAFTEIDSVISTSAASLDDHIAASETFINELLALTKTDFTLNYGSNLSYAFLFDNSNMTSALTSNKPVKPANLNFVPQTSPTSPDDPDIRDSIEISLPDFAVQPPVVTIPEAPTIDDLPTIPQEPTLNDVFIPLAPDYELPELPVLAQIEFPTSPGLSIPEFTEQIPDLPEFLLETNKFEYNEPDYQNDLLDDIESLLISDVNDGEFGITPDDEEALYDRFKDRTSAEARGREGEIARAFAIKGFPLPPGPLLAELEKDAENTQFIINEGNREILVNRAELLRRGREFAITQGLSLNELLLRDHGFKQERALNAARFAAEFEITLLDAQIRRYNAIVERYQIFAQAYEVQIRSLLAQTDMYKTEVQAAVAKQEANKLQIDIYEAQVNALNTIVNLYESEVRAAQVKTEIERNKIAIFETKVRAFLAQIDAKKSEVDLYDSIIQGELVKTQIFNSQVSAFSEQVRAAGIESDIQNRNIQSDIAKAELELREYQTNIDKYRADVQAELARVGSLVDIYEADSSVLDSVISAWAAIMNIDIAAAKAFVDSKQEDTRIQQERTKIKLSELTEEANIRTLSSTVGAKIYEGLVAAAAAQVSGTAYEFKDTSA